MPSENSEGTGQLGLVWEQGVQCGHERSQNRDGQTLRSYKHGKAFRRSLMSDRDIVETDRGSRGKQSPIQ